MSRAVPGALFALLVAGIAVAAKNPPDGMALIPSGDYSPLLSRDNFPQVVHVPAFYLDQRPATNAEFLRFVLANPEWRRSGASPMFAEPGYLADWSGDTELGPNAPADAPVVRVSWFAARAYARWRGLRLPTAAEWERAASAGFVTENGATEAAYRDAVMQWLSSPTPPLLPASGSGRPNAYGVRDLMGLVWEWVDDFSGAPGADGEAPDKNLVCGAAGAGVRNFTDYPAFARLEFRSSLSATFAVPNLGFRCARSP